MKKEIRVYHTHIEVEPYEQGEKIRLEQSLSLFNRMYHKWIPIAYSIENNVLYLPRGIDVDYLRSVFKDTLLTVSREYDKVSFFPQYEMLKPPLGKIEEDSIKFLSAEEEFKKARYYSQLSLNIDTGDGKTYSTISSILRKRKTAIIITHKKNIKKQWIDTCKDLTNIPNDKIIDIENSNILDKIMNDELRGYIYFVTHQCLQAFAKRTTWDHLGLLFKKLGIGRKVFDEAHKHFKNILKIDSHTNTEVTIYLTATFKRNKYNEKKVFDYAFSNVYRFGEETYNYAEKIRHIIYIPLLYDSGATQNDIYDMKTPAGLSPYLFIDYALDKDPNETLLNKLEYVLRRVSKLEGKILITTPKISSSNTIKKLVEEILPTKTVSTINSSNSDKENEDNKESDIISSTLSSFDSGTDVKGLRVLINAGPHSSESLASQLPGRLRKYSDDTETFYIDLIDMSVPECYEMYKRRLPILKKKCKKILKWDMC